MDEVKITNEMHTSRDEIYDDFYKCPNCLNDEIRKCFNYCPMCGLKIDTSETTEINV